MACGQEPDTTQSRLPPDGLSQVAGSVNPSVGNGVAVLVQNLVGSAQEGSPVAWTDFQGSVFRINCPQGLFTLFVRGTRTNWSRLPVYVELDHVEVGTLELKALSMDACVSGTVTDIRGASVPGARVSYPAIDDGELSFPFTEITDSTGAFVICPTQALTYIQVFKDGLEPEFVEIETGRSDNVRVVLSERGARR